MPAVHSVFSPISPALQAKKGAIYFTETIYADDVSSACPIIATRFINPMTNEVQRVNVFRI